MNDRQRNRNPGRQQGRKPGRYDNRINIDHESMTNYYDEQGHLKRDVFIKWPKKLAQNTRVTRTSLRSLYDFVAALHFRIRMGEEPRGVLQPGIGQLHRYAQYQTGRGGIIDKNTCDFIQTHCDKVGSDKKQFEGFFQLFQSFMAYLRRN